MKVYNLKQDNNVKRLSIFGIRIYKKWKSGNFIKRAYLCGILQSRKTKYSRSYYIFGIKFYGKKDKIRLLEDKIKNITNEKWLINDKIQTAITVSKHHNKIFPYYKNRHSQQIGVLVATGPTLLHYKKFHNYIHFAVNNAYSYLTPDYWFAIDGFNIAQSYEELSKTAFTKFFGQCITPYPIHKYRSDDKKRVYHIPDCIIDSSNNAHKFYFDHPSLRINRDIENHPLPDLGSCVFSALYFALYTGIKKIYIVGCDCACNGYFNGVQQAEIWSSGRATNMLLKGWNIIKEYIETFYPDVEIISINPVGLKGMFKDVYTQSYLDANPDIKEELGDNVEILDEKEFV